MGKISKDKGLFTVCQTNSEWTSPKKQRCEIKTSRNKIGNRLGIPYPHFSIFFSDSSVFHKEI